MALFSHGKIVTVLQYFTDKVEDYWHILYPLVPKKERDNDRYLYFYDISKKATLYKGKFNEDGLYLFLGYDGEYHLHALELAQYSLACWLAWRKSGEELWKRRALLHCDWLVSNQNKDGSWSIIHKNPSYKDLPSPWSSALAQGFAISSLLRAYYNTGNDDYLLCAKRALLPLEMSVDSKGLKREFTKEEVRGFIYEEYPRKDLSGVLNGYISVILAIYELSKVDKEYRLLFKKNIENLKHILPLYECGYWSYYSLDGVISSGFYHRLVVRQLAVLSEFDEFFHVYFNKWMRYQENKFFAWKAFLVKIKAKL